ncbi:MAG: hypothetical protein K8L99_33890 [Anaerolineae bacterium]|nr:hypothetical protein [Anaerolineae bacterium]
MVHDLRALGWLRWKQFKLGAVYWLRVLGYQPNQNSFLQNMYVVYLLAIGAFWVFAMWAYSFDAVTGLGNLLGENSPGTLIAMINIIPPLVLLVQIYVMINALRSTPLKLSFSDMAYVAGSPMSRAAPVILGFLRQVLTRWLILGVPFALFAVMVVNPFTEHADASTTLRALGVMLPLVVITWGMAWVLGVLRLVYPAIRRWRYIWVLPLLLLGLAWVAPDLVYWPGRAAVLVLYNAEPIWLWPALILLAAGLVALFIWQGDHINMIQAVDESQLYARIQKLGILAWRQADLQMRIRMQSAQASRKPFLRLPRVYGWQTLTTRAAVSYIRHPFMLLLSVVWGAAIAQAGVWIIANNLPVQLWIGWLLVIGIAPPVGLLYVFRIDVEERFLRQFLPFNGFQLLMADIVLPYIAVVVGAGLVWAVQGFDPAITMSGLIFIPLLALMLALCGAYAVTTTRVLQTRLLSTGLSFGLPIVAGVVTGSPLAALVVALLAISTLIGLVIQNA